MYEEDTPRSLYNEMLKVENEVESIGRNIKTLAIVEAQTAGEYEHLKNQKLITLYAEEVDQKFKRTEAQRTAIYRTEFASARLAMYLAKADLKSERDLLDALKAKLQSIQSRKGIMLSEIEVSARRT